jgi:hypothetical protein
MLVCRPADPAKFNGSLSVPGDGQSYDIFTQVGKAIGPNRKSLISGSDPMGGLAVKRLIGVGASQSGIRLLSYANGVQPLENVYHAIIPGMGSGQAVDFEESVAEDMSANMAGSDTLSAAAALAATAKAASRRLRPVWVREDSSIPVMVFNSEAEADWTSQARQPETDKYRHWEVAGARHGPSTLMLRFNLKTDRDGLTNVTIGSTITQLLEADWQPVMAAAFWHINNWIDGGAPPPIMPLIEVTETNGKLEFSRDQYGNTLGGIRLPEVEVPYAQIVINTRSRMLPGASTFPFPTAYLKRLYPTHDDYVTKVTEAVNKAQAQGIILQHAADDYIKRAKAAPIPEPNYSDAIKDLLIQ